MTSARLPDVPEGQDLEDSVAAFLQCAGFYTEKSVIERGETEVMEIDVLAWKPKHRIPHHTLFEVKGGDWGFPDVFKVLGWKTYLEARRIDAAYLIAPRGDKPKNVVEYIGKKCNDVEMGLIAYEEPRTIESSLSDSGIIRARPDSIDHEIWRFSSKMERQMQKVVTHSRRTEKDAEGPDKVYQYQELIKNGFLQAMDVRERLASLYSAHFDHQFLAKSVAAEMDSGNWDPRHPAENRIFKDALYECKHWIVQAAMYYEHRARLGILKGAVEFALLQEYDVLPPERTIEFLGIQMPADFLPCGFHKTVEDMKFIENFERIPVLWQSFLWKWGGFFLVDREDEEKAALAEEVGMTVDSVNAAMSLYMTLFPIQEGWFNEIQGAKILKLFPCPFRGIGAHYRRKRMDDYQSATSGSSKYRYLGTNLSRWIASAICLLNYGETSKKE